MKLPQLVVFGEALADFIREDNQRWRSAPGGSCRNVARVGARLGVATGFGGTVSQDTFGDDLMRLSAQAGSTCASLVRSSARRSSPPWTSDCAGLFIRFLFNVFF